MEKFTKDIKDASEITKKFNEDLKAKLPFDDDVDFKEAQKGFIATDENLVIKVDDSVLWDLKSYEFLKGDWQPTVNPSLWRQAQLNLYSGLYKVQDRIYQIRSYDVSNITVIEGDTGLIVIDPLVSVETAKAAMELYYKNIGKKPVKAVIFTHSHWDHYGGVAGVITQEQVDKGEVEVIAPEGFLMAAVSENIFAGNAMTRRANYMYGITLNESAQEQVDVGLGKNVALGTTSLINPTKTIGKSGEKITVDGVDIRFLMASGTEAPSEFMMYYPQFKVFNVAEVVTHHIHNILTLRGAQVRDAKKWWKAIDNILLTYGDQIETLIAQHHWPKWGNEEIVDMLQKQRNAYKFLHDQSLRLANQGYTPIEISEEMKLPKTLENEWHLRNYYGSFNHNSKAIYQFYLGWYDGNPANLYALPPEKAAKRYVEFMGGFEEVLKKAKKSFDEGDYRWVAEVCKHLVFADPNNKNARYLEADALEQLGYQTESGPWRNNFLVGAAELRGTKFQQQQIQQMR
ncbi:alkyl/aryl-sulfatase [Methanobacterium petrolearium]|uniref:alkyl/aryl-sulfatase n=1 Tax=Methanobacterium petrolearium TaxID=710190 RepID=UPI003081429F|nr:alkyl sulfatase [Methanobacterium petrolearium]